MSQLFRNGRFFTAPTRSEPAEETVFADCIIVNDGIISHIGHESDVEVQLIRGEGSPVVDLQNRIVVPGFIDGHMHLLMLGQALTKLSLEACKNLEDIRAAIKSYAGLHLQAPRILCRGWMHSMTDGQALASMLDDLDERPVFIDSKDLHSTWCNTAALKELEVDSVADPVGGKVHRDEHGRPSGLLSETAAQIFVWPHIARVASLKEKLGALRGAFHAYTAAGYTGIVDMAMDENAWEALQILRSKEDIPFRIAAYWLIQPSTDKERNLAQVDQAIALHQKFNEGTSPDFRIAGIKIICDGVVDACTAALCEPYANGLSAESLWPAEMLSPVVQRADSAGLQCALHAIGDQAIKIAIDALEPCCQRGKGGRRHRVEHLELASLEDAKRLGQLGITASIQPVHADPAILRAWPNLIGKHRCSRAFAYREFLAGGATLALGSDSPTAPFTPLSNIYVASTRRSAREPGLETKVNENFAISLSSAFSAATTGAAYSCFSEQRVGSLRKGLKADFAVLDMEWATEDLLHARVIQTWFEGKMVYSQS
ncbi:Uncharacterized protein BP5553_09565 [Venustampulla echinocandica]|uniref:Amidohydrolase 3 domain-containing protein n=1 Tax=Venustampulla echinocandica TaxID=2656787 RepID=A0A370TBE7_9HELO|nr:Uncharacterized protein BP5553_09565 [Venustampulla echinocandica]RDL31356.1 Uncharacterized protein BP5553_09565 [Venustampulla echinocandica]